MTKIENVTHALVIRLLRMTGPPSRQERTRHAGASWPRLLTSCLCFIQTSYLCQNMRRSA